MTAIRSVASTLLIALVFVALFVVLSNIVVASELSNLPRLTTDYSPAYLRRKFDAMAKAPPSIMVLGDSVLWGYRLQPSQGAVALLRANGYRLDNLAFKGSSPPNYYAMLRAALASGVRPKAILLEIDDKVLNPADDAYGKLNPSLASVAWPTLSTDDRTRLALDGASSGLDARFERDLGCFWLVYGLRADLRETLAGDVDVVPQQKPTPDLYEGTYDLTPLGGDNLGVVYLRKTLDLARRHGIRVAAFFPPVNHALLHDYIDSPAYVSNLRYLRRMLVASGAAVTDLDARFPASAFFDNSHLTPIGQQGLTIELERALKAIGETAP